MTGLYAALIRADLSVYAIIVLFGLFVAGAMHLVKRRHAQNQREFDAVALLEDSRH
jgi:hypothetical protein